MEAAIDLFGKQRTETSIVLWRQPGKIFVDNIAPKSNLCPVYTKLLAVICSKSLGGGSGGKLFHLKPGMPFLY